MQDNEKNIAAETAGPGKFVAYSYRLYDDANGELLFETPEGAPDAMVMGVSLDVVPGLASALEGLKTGDKFELTLPPEAGFGQRYEENVLKLDRNLFERDGELAEEVKPGAELPMMTQDGYRVLGRVISVDDSKVVMDFNHPFAGKTVRFDGMVEQVRHATPDELNPKKGCGGCCGGGDCGGGSCGDGCGDGCGCN